MNDIPSKDISVNGQAMNDQTGDDHAALSTLIQTTVAALKAARGNETDLAAAVTAFFNSATEASMSLEDIENILGVAENCIMDLAELSEADEETLITTFEAISNS